VKAGERLKTGCPTYQMLTPTGRVEAMEKRLEATLAAVKTVQPALAKFYNSLSDEQKARFNSLLSASRPTGRSPNGGITSSLVGGPDGARPCGAIRSPALVASVDEE